MRFSGLARWRPTGQKGFFRIFPRLLRHHHCSDLGRHGTVVCPYILGLDQTHRALVTLSLWSQACTYMHKGFCPLYQIDTMRRFPRFYDDTQRWTYT